MLFEDLTRAFDNDEFFPAFQPIIELRTGQLVGFEVLARWRHPQHGLILPDVFIPQLEQSGQIDRLTKVIVEKAFACPVLTHSHLTVSINLSSLQLMDFKLPERIALSAELTGFPLHCLNIEITESALLGDLSRALQVVTELKSLRCRLALDDFGTGYSSLRHLHALPFDELKIDRGFVSSMTEQRESRKIVASVVGLGQSLGLVTVAEGVERSDQSSMLLWMGCDLAQGWLYGKAIAPDQLEDAVRRLRSAPHPAIPPKASETSLAPDGAPGHRLAQLQAIYDGAPVGLCLLDRNLRYLSLNRRLAEFNGISAEAHLGHSPEEIVPAIFSLIEPFLRKALSGEPTTSVEIHKPPRLSDGEPQTLLASYQPVRDEGGEVLGVSVAIMDITDRKRMEDSLREVEEHYRTWLDHVPHVPWVLSKEGLVLDAGAYWEKITGQPLTEALGNGWLKALHPDDISIAQQTLRNAVEARTSINLMYRVRDRKGEWRWMRSRGSPRLSSSGDILGFYGVLEELTGSVAVAAES